MRRKSDNPKEPDWFVLSRESGEHLEKWRRYLVARLGFLPAGFQMMEAGKIETFLVPSDVPELFDSSAMRVT